MKNFHYCFTSRGTLNIWLEGVKKQRKLLAEIEPAFTQTAVKHTRGSGMVPLRQTDLNKGDLPVIIECLLYYQQYYNLN